MRIISILLFAAGIHCSARGFSQQITLSFHNAKLTEVLYALENQSKFKFIYSAESMAASLPVTIEAKNELFESVLKRCFDGQPLIYNIEEAFVIIKTNKQAATRTAAYTPIHGKVLNEYNEPVVGITISVKGTNKLTASDVKGEFVLTDAAIGTLLVISGAEIEDQEVNVYADNIVIKVRTRIGELDKAIVIGYGETTRRVSTGSVTKVGSDIISLQPVSNPLAALQGRVPGLIVTSTSGLPGASFNVQIRGQNSLNPNPNEIYVNPLDNPLFIIDGVPFAPQNTNTNLYSSAVSPGLSQLYQNPYGGISPFNSINPNDIESIEILRDADATAIYGSRGANGVILITTKKGKEGTTRFNINLNSGISRTTRTMSMMNTQQYLQMRREAIANDGYVPSNDPYDPGYAPDLLVFDSTKFTDWKKYFLGGNAQATDLNASLTGGTSNTQFLIGAGFNNQSSILPGDLGYRRGSFNMNFKYTSPDKHFSVEVSSNYSSDRNNSSSAPDILQAFTLAPNNPNLIDENGNLVWNYKGVSIKNSLGYLKQKYLSTHNNLISHLLVNYEIIPGLNVRTNFGYSQFTGNETLQVPRSAQDPALNPTAYASFGRNQFDAWIMEPQLEYRKPISKGKLSLLFGSTIQQNSNSRNSADGYGYASDILLGSISGARITYNSDGYSQYKYVAAFGRVNYIWDNKYILNLNGRRDGSSRFGPGNQFGNFGSVGAAWIFSEEKPFKKHHTIFSYGKFKASYGTTGNDNIGDYQYLTRWATSTQTNGVVFMGNNTYLPQNLSNPNFSWSITKKLEGSMEVGFFKDRLLLNVTWFHHRSSNQLITYSLPSQSGFTGVTENFPAVVQNTGVEISGNISIVKQKSFTWLSSLAVTIPRNKLIRFAGIENSSYYYLYTVGQPLDMLNRVLLSGVNPSTGVYEYHTKEGNSISPNTTEDAVVIGSSGPKYYGGINNSFSIKGFQVDLFFELRKQLGQNYLSSALSYPSGYVQNQPTDLLRRWQKAGDQTGIEKFTSNPSSDAAVAAVYFPYSNGAYSDASYIRLKTFSISYSIPNDILQKTGLQRCLIYVHAQNLFTITHYKGNDPETQSFYSIPPLKAIVAGLSLTF
ncbi:MAG: SusC/RagA family TonB-linked outer membrane protein [Chitinophagaceae bacterium]